MDMLTLQNRISELEKELELNKLLHTQRVQELEQEIQQQDSQHSQQATVWMKHIQDVESQLQHLQEENRPLSNCRIKENKESQIRDPRAHNGILKELDSDQIKRYSRQLLLEDGFGVEGQCKLLSSSVLVVGAGGIGSTVLLYLAASGVGNITVVDFDQVEMSNLHRQVIHKEANVGLNKAISACRAVLDLNPTIQCNAIQEVLTHENALKLISRHDCVVDASDNPRTRYLINDACVLSGKPLVSGSAMGTEGQLTVYNHAGGPCYRCLYPKTNPTEGCKSCSDSGVLGPVPGLIGILQALEVLKILTGVGATMHDRLLMYDALRCSFMNIRKPPKSPKCTVCGDDASILSMIDSHNVSQTARGPSGIIDGSKKISHTVPPALGADWSVSCSEYDRIRSSGEPHILLDVRVQRQFDMCSLDGAIHIPFGQLPQELDRVAELSGGTKPVFCLCRRGVLSVEATRVLSEALESHPSIVSVRNIAGGLEAWCNEVDPSFPKY